VLLALGLRQGEARSLKWDDVDLERHHAFEAQLAADRKNRIAAGQQLLANKNVHPSGRPPASAAGRSG
jgi:integrase